jgi:hypothetical protein
MCATANGYDTIVELLLKTSKINVDGEDVEFN